MTMISERRLESKRLPNHRVRLIKDNRWNRDAENPGSSDVDDQFEIRYLFEGKFRRLGAFLLSGARFTGMNDQKWSILA
jgi:hypothetical protein